MLLVVLDQSQGDEAVMQTMRFERLRAQLEERCTLVAAATSPPPGESLH